MGTASQSPVSAQETPHVKIDQEYEKMFLVPVVYWKSYIGAQADSENLAYNLKGMA
jgi:hypothetical protein